MASGSFRASSTASDARTLLPSHRQRSFTRADMDSPAPGMPLSQSNGLEQKFGWNHFSKRSSLSSHCPVPGYSDLAFSQLSWIVSALAGDSHCRTLERRRSRSASLASWNAISANFRTFWISSNSTMPAWLSIRRLCCCIFVVSPSILQLKPLHVAWKSFLQARYLLSRNFSLPSQVRKHTSLFEISEGFTMKL
jgi:hypothetical protein